MVGGDQGLGMGRQPEGTLVKRYKISVRRNKFRSLYTMMTIVNNSCIVFLKIVKGEDFKCSYHKIW